MHSVSHFDAVRSTTSVAINAIGGSECEKIYFKKYEMRYGERCNHNIYMDFLIPRTALNRKIRMNTHESYVMRMRAKTKQKEIGTV